MRKFNFSICVIAKNEAKTLPNLVASVKKYMDEDGLEINVLDTGSTDGTPEIARSLGCRVDEVGTEFLTVLDDEIIAKIKAAQQQMRGAA